MLQVSKLIVQGRGLAPVLLKRAATLELDWAGRQNSRFDASDSTARRLAVLLPPGTRLRGGDVLVAEDGSMIKVLAAPQAVMRITACKSHGSPLDLTRAAYQLGLRQVAIELKPDHLKIEADPALAALLHAMHMDVATVDEGFEPEDSADSRGGSRGHNEHAGHVHGPDCKHEHGPSPAHGHDQDHGRAVRLPARSLRKAL